MSQIKITLPDYWNECPPAWNKMIDAIEDIDANYNEWGDVTDAAIRRQLKKVGARWSVPTETMIFPNEKSYTLWLLRFS